MLLALGCVILLATVVLMVKQYETRMVLFVAGLLMAVLAGQPLAAFTGFSGAMLESKVFESIIAVMGFALVILCDPVLSEGDPGREALKTECAELVREAVDRLR